jgi:hypothetical protein
LYRSIGWVSRIVTVRDPGVHTPDNEALTTVHRTSTVTDPPCQVPNDDGTHDKSTDVPRAQRARNGPFDTDARAASRAVDSDDACDAARAADCAALVTSTPAACRRPT